MWISLSDSFLSIVAFHCKPQSLLVRARVAGDIERVFPQATITHTPKADYAYRAEVPRTEVAAALVATVDTITYDNFKNSVSDRARHDAYFACWGAMYDLQQKKANRRVR